MGFRQLKTAALAASKTTQQEPEEVDVETTTTKKATTTSLALPFAPAGTVLTSLVAELVQTADPSSQVPMVYVSGGKTGGAFTVNNYVPDEIAAVLPQGKKPIAGVLLGFRVTAAAWPVGYNDRADDKQGPAWTCVVSSASPAELSQVLRIAKSRQYTSKDEKAKWDYATSGCGHVVPQLQILLYVPELENAIAVASTTHYNSCVDSMQSLGSVADELAPMPLVLTPATATVKISGFSVAQHHIDCAVDVSKRGKDAMASFQEWLANLSDEDKQELTDWCATDIGPAAAAGIAAGLAV